MAELGRSCVHPDYRSGSVIALLWMGLADYMTRNGFDYVVGCASIGMTDGGHLAASVYRHISARHLSPVGHAAQPPAAGIAGQWHPRPAAATDQGLSAIPPTY